jgi:hypothetical protein
MCLIIRQLFQSSSRMQMHGRSGWWKMYLKPVRGAALRCAPVVLSCACACVQALFVMTFLLIWICIFSYRFYALVKQDGWVTESVAYFGCLVRRVHARGPIDQPLNERVPCAPACSVPEGRRAGPVMPRPAAPQPRHLVPHSVRRGQRGYLELHTFQQLVRAGGRARLGACG